MKAVTYSAAALLLTAGQVSAFWRLPCRGRLGVARIDPLMDFGIAGSHAHSIQGGNAFSETSLSDDLLQSDCTSCAVTQDKSAYWAPALYFMYDNGTTALVEQSGGQLVYYLLYGDPEPFPSGFRMIAGDTLRRNYTLPLPTPPESEWTGAEASQDGLEQKALGFNCLDYSKAAEASLYRHYMPTKDYIDANCPDGVRFELMFPSCWNGVDLDSDDHKSHMAYPSGVMDGTCPDGFSTRLVSMFFETIWNTFDFADESGTFVIANGDTTGYGYHGDFIAAWEDGVLESAVETCTNASGEIADCAVFDIQSDDDAAQCTLTMPSNLDNEDDTDPNTTGLPANVAIQTGPDDAIKGLKTAAGLYANVNGNGANGIIAGASTVSTAAVASVSSSSEFTLGYTAAQTTYTDDSGGGIKVYATAASASATTFVPSYTAATSAYTTVAPVASSLPDGEDILSTTIYTSNGIVYDVVVVEEEITVTVTATDSAAATSSVAAVRRGMGHRHKRDYGRIIGDSHMHGHMH